MKRYLILLLFTLSKSKEIKLCEYLNAIGKATPECASDEVTVQRTSEDVENVTRKEELPSPLAKIISNIEKREKTKGMHALRHRPSCNSASSFKECQIDRTCASGYSCLQSMGSKDRCCMTRSSSAKPPSILESGQCPTVSKMGYVCSINRAPIDWCKRDDDCGKNSMLKCCETGCGFKVCVSPSRQSKKKTFSLRPSINNWQRDDIVRSDCPAPSAMHTTCRKNKFRNTSWCTTDASCQNGLTPDRKNFRTDRNIAVRRPADTIFVSANPAMIFVMG
ncbi:unnamed protein product [Caenorhabditis auriculariae]|uniref:WAP domain-containing protein n=1 Tax=Caenorhabditis auriculariae TaxID=2777116 RepID=A0A8S1H5W6_9PELO|nr:unnamed protein product [Caenorhabditis auriculariae]